MGNKSIDIAAMGFPANWENEPLWKWRSVSNNDKGGWATFTSWNIDGGSVNSDGVSTNSDGVFENGGDVLRRESCEKQFAVNIWEVYTYVHRPSPPSSLRWGWTIGVGHCEYTGKKRASHQFAFWIWRGETEKTYPDSTAPLKLLLCSSEVTLLFL